MDTASAQVLAEIAHDAGPFIRLGRQFKCNKVAWVGPTIASPLAVYMLKVSRLQSHGGGGLAGALIAAAMQGADDGISTCTFIDLPTGVQNQLDMKRKHQACQVVIIPKATVNRVKSSKFNNALTLNVGTDRFALVTGILSIFRIPRQLQEMGWQLNTDLTPVAGPVHDLRAANGATAPGKPMWQRVLYLTLGIGLIILVIVLRVYFDVKRHH